MVDHRRVRLDHHVAEAADAWLTDPTDTGVYTRLVAAVTARRAYVYPVLADGGGQDDDALTLPETLGSSLTGLEPQAVVADLVARSDVQAP